MKRFLVIITALLFAATAVGQTAYEKIMADQSYALGVYRLQAAPVHLSRRSGGI